MLALFRRSLSAKLTASLVVPRAIGIVVAAVFLSQTLGDQASQQMIQNSRIRALATSSSLQASLTSEIATARSLSNVVIAGKQSGAISRASLTALMRKTLEDNPSLLGIWARFEPNGFDGRDQEFIGTAHGDAKGRYAVYVARRPAGITVEAQQSADGSDAPAAYREPKRTHSEAIIEPTSDQAGRESAMRTTFSEPIMVDGQFVGAIGVDFNLPDFQKLIDPITLPSNRRVSVLSAAGNWVSDRDPGRTGKSAVSEDPALAETLKHLDAHDPHVERLASRLDQGVDTVRILAPLPIGSGGAQWTVMVSYPASILFENSNRFVRLVILSGALGILVSIVVVTACTQWLAGRPLRKLVSYLRPDTVDGVPQALDPALLARGDEIGAMARTVAQLHDVSAQNRESERRAAQAVTQGVVVRGLATGLTALANGELTYHIDEAFPPEYEELRRNFNATATRLRATILSILESADALGAGTAEISRATDELARRTEDQAVNLEQAVHALGSITKSVSTTAQQAEVARGLAESVKAKGEMSSLKARASIETMAAIDESTSQIAKTLTIIHGIAGQTNLLALNAAVEAARAGDAGRGFAVVATEVRDLAKRSANAAREIDQLIQNSNRHVREGVTLVGETGTAFNQIMAEAVAASIAVTEIAASAQDQATALQQLNAAAGGVGQGNQRNAAMVEETTTATTTLAGKSAELLQLTQWFKVGAR